MRLLYLMTQENVEKNLVVFQILWFIKEYTRVKNRINVSFAKKHLHQKVTK